MTNGFLLLTTLSAAEYTFNDNLTQIGAAATAMVADNRESGESPERSRRCKESVSFHNVTVKHQNLRILMSGGKAE